MRFTKAKARRRSATRTLTAEQVVFSASALGTQRLLHRMRDEGHLPRVSQRLGYLSRTNSESILGAIAPDTKVDYSQGVAITSSFHPDEHTHIEPVRYGKGSNAMSLMQTVLTDGDGPRAALATWLKEMWKERAQRPRPVRRAGTGPSAPSSRWSCRRSTTRSRCSPSAARLTGRWHLSSRQGHGIPNPTWIPVANQAVRKMAEIVGGKPGGSIGEPFNRPLTAHFIGGCTIGDDAETGVIDPYQRMYGHPGLHVVDGSAIIGEPRREPVADDHRPGRAGDGVLAEQGRGRPATRPRRRRTSGSRRSPPAHPAVPDAAPGALRLPIVSVS